MGCNQRFSMGFVFSLGVSLWTGSAQAQNINCETTTARESATPGERAVREVSCNPQVVELVLRAQQLQQSLAMAVVPEAEPSPAVVSSPPWVQPPAAAATPLPRRPIFGVMVSAGLPEGGAISLSAEPFKWLRLYVGATHNTAGPGVRGGITLMPLSHWFLSPVLSLEGGHSFEGDANWLARLITANTQFETAVLRRVSYDYASGRLGLEFGNRNFRFFIYAGVSYVRTQSYGFQESLRQYTHDDSLIATDPVTEALIPSGATGLLWNFW